MGAGAGYSTELMARAVAPGGSIATVVSVPGMAYGAKTLYLKSRHGVGHQSFLAITAITALFSVTLGGLAALFGLAVLGGRGVAIHGPVLALVGGVPPGPRALPRHRGVAVTQALL